MSQETIAETLQPVRDRPAADLPGADFDPHDRPGGLPARMEPKLLVDALLDGVPGPRLAVPAEDVPFPEGHADPRARGPARDVVSPR